MAAFIKRIQNTASQYSLWNKGSKLVVAVSGGPDSVCLLNILVTLQKKYAWELHIAHVNYGLRGDDSKEDEKLVKKLAKQYHIPCSVLKVKVTEHNNLEERLRKIRYDFFEDIRTRYGFDSIATAHTLDDQAETVLMRLLRGSGLQGLRSMRITNGKIIRPLLFTERSAVMHYLTQHNLPYRIDITNKDMRFYRNKVRHQLLPYLQEYFNPNIKQTLSKTAHVLSEDYATLHSLTSNHTLPYHKNDTNISFLIEDFLQLPKSSQRTYIRLFCLELLSNTRNISFASVEELIKTLKNRDKKSLETSFKGLKVTLKNATVSITRI